MDITDKETNSTSEWSVIVNTCTGVLGSIIFFANFAIMSLIIYLMVRRPGRKEGFSFLVHLLSVSVNDTLCGLMVCTMAVITVDGEGIAKFCVYVLFLALTLQSASQGNICCVSAQRYVFSRNIRQNALTWRMFHTKTLLIVNVFVAFGTFVSYAVGGKVETDFYGDGQCYFSNVLDQDVGTLIRMYFMLGISFTFVSDVLCFLTIWKLRSNRGGTVRPDTSISTGNTGSSNSSQNSLVSNTTKGRQRKAVVTIMLILGFFNMSVLPSFIGFMLKNAGVVYGTNTKRVLVMSMFINSLINPVIIATRVNDIRSLICGFFTNVISYVAK